MNLRTAAAYIIIGILQVLLLILPVSLDEIHGTFFMKSTCLENLAHGTPSTLIPSKYLLISGLVISIIGTFVSGKRYSYILLILSAILSGFLFSTLIQYTHFHHNPCHEIVNFIGAASCDEHIEYSNIIYLPLLCLLIACAGALMKWKVKNNS